MTASGTSTTVDLVVFDLDGTLVDSRADICASIRKTCTHMGEPSPADETLAPLIGIPLVEIFKRLLPGADPSRVESACAFYRSWYFDHCAEKTRPFPGVLDCLDALSGVRLAIGTGKMRFQAVRVLDLLGLLPRFDLVVGSDGLPYKPDPASLNVILRELGVAPHRAFMVGDTTLDVLAGKAAGMRTCALTWGTGTRAELESVAPDLLLDSLVAFPDQIGMPRRAAMAGMS